MSRAKIEQLQNKIRSALADPKAPWYGSDLVAWVGDYIEEVVKLRAENKELKRYKEAFLMSLKDDLEGE